MSHKKCEHCGNARIIYRTAKNRCNLCAENAQRVVVLDPRFKEHLNQDVNFPLATPLQAADAMLIGSPMEKSEIDSCDLPAKGKNVTIDARRIGNKIVIMEARAQTQKEREEEISFYSIGTYINWGGAMPMNIPASPKVVMTTSRGSGKTTLMENISKYIHDTKERVKAGAFK